MSAKRYVGVFAGSNAGAREAYGEAARALARALAERDLGMVYGAGCVGLMGIAADEALSLGVPVVGVIPDFLVEREVAHEALTERIDVETMLDRKTVMAERSDAFVALPGGLGTYDEIFEMVTWTQLSVQDKPTGLLNVESYFDPLVTMLEQAHQEGFIRAAHTGLLVSETDPARLLDRLLG